MDSQVLDERIIKREEEKLREREEAKIRKRKQRAREKEVRARLREETAPKKFLSNEEWWAKNRQSLTAEQIAEFEAREGRVILWEIHMAYHLNDIAEDIRTPLPKLIGQVERDVREYGLRYHPDLNFHEFNDEIDYKTGSGNYLETYKQIWYGFSTAIEAQLFWNFKHRFVPVPPPKCMTHHCPNPQNSKIEPWFCEKCSAERKRRSDAHHGFCRTPEPAANRPYGTNCEWRTPETSVPAWFGKALGA